MNMYVSNLEFHVEDEDLLHLFSEYGDVTSATIMKDKFSGLSKGFGFVEMSDDTEANKAMSELNGRMLAGRAIHVAIDKQRKEKDNDVGGRRNFGNSRW